MARPREFTKREALRVRVPPGLAVRARIQARARCMNLNEWLLQVVLAALEKAEKRGPVVRRAAPTRRLRAKDSA